MQELTVTHFIEQVLPHCIDVEVLKLKAAVDAMIETMEERKRLRYKAKLASIREELAKQMEDLKKELGVVDEPKKVKHYSPKFQNPDNPLQTWSGRGRQPEWFIKALEAGISLDDLLVSNKSIATEITDIPF